jgi:hypothetical protein
MLQIHDVANAPCFSPRGRSLSEQIADAVRDRATPISKLLRLMAAVDQQGGDEGLRRVLRARIGAPLDS